MEAASVTRGTVRRGRRGRSSSAARSATQQRRHRRRLDRSGLQPGRGDRLHRRRRRHRDPHAGRDHRLVPPDVLHRARVPQHEPGRPRLRHDVLVDDAGDGRRLGLGRRLGGDLRRHRRQRQPGADRRHLRVQAVRPQRRGEQQVGRDDPRGRVHRRADVDLLAGDRALGPHPAAAARLRAGDAADLRGRRADQGLHRPSPGSIHVRLDWFNPFSVGFTPLLDGLLLGVFLFWGWDSGVSVNEETENAARRLRAARPSPRRSC